MARTDPTPDEIDELVAFLPLLDAEGLAPIVRWGGGERLADGSHSMPWPEYAPVVARFYGAAAKECWSDFTYVPELAARMLADGAGVATASLAHVKTMLTYCVRGERFCEGHWAAMINAGHIQRLLSRLRVLRERERGRCCQVD